MNKAVFTIIAAISIFSAEPMYGADQRLAFSHKGYRDCHDVWRCGPIGCRATLVCARACPDRYSCYSLYGAYGPYGGSGYWAAYTSYRW